MLIKIHKNRTVSSSGTWGTKNENNYEILNFEFPEELEEYNKRIVYYLDNQKVWDPIINNKAILTNAITTKGSVKAYIWCTKSDEAFETDVDFRTQIFVMNFFENDNADGIVPTPEQVDGFNTMLTAMNEKIKEIDELETTIENAETQRQENEETRQENESTRQDNEQTRQSQEADRERRTDEAIGNIKDKTAEYNQNAEAKTNEFNQNATQKTNDFNSNYTQKVNDFNTNASSKKSAFNSNAESKTSTFNTNATNKTNDFNSNATSKTTDFNTNAENKTTAFNDNATQKTTNFDNNASSKTTTFNENATSKTNDFNDNATAKTTAFNDNAQAKTEAFDEHTAEITADIEDLQEEVEELSQNMPWNETEQATSIDITDAAKYSKNKMKLFGNTEQTQYSGKNLFNGTYQKATVGGVNGRTYQTSTAGRTAVIPCLSNTAYTITKYETSDRYRVYDSSEEPISGASLDVLANQDNADTITITTNADANYLIVYVSTSSEQAEPTMQVEEGSTATDYEPYTGGQPSPSPDYPQPIHVVTGNNSIGVTGKNLLDTSDGIQTGTSQGIKATRNADGTYTFIGTSTSVTINIFIYGNFAIYNNYTNWEDFDKTKIVFDIEPGTYTVTDMVLFIIFEDGTKMTTSIQLPTRSKTFTITKKGHIVAVRTPQVQNNTQYNIILYPQLEKGSVATSYEPYTHRDYSLNLGSLELCKIGDYQDYLYKENENWYKYGAIDKYVYNDDLTPNSLTESQICMLSPELNLAGNLGGGQLGAISYCNIMRTTITNNTGLNGTTGAGKIRINMNTSYASSYNEFKQLCADNNLTIYFGAKVPVITQITDTTLIAQLEAIYEHFKLTKGINNITVTAEDLAPYMQLNYMQDQQKKFENIINSTYTNVMEGEY